VSEGITQAEYENEVENMASHLADAAEEDVEDGVYDEYHGAVVDLSADTLDAHQWFARTYHGPADHGAIIEYARDAGVDPVQYGDLTHIADSEDPERIVKMLAYKVFEAHVIDTALARERGAT